MPRSPEASARDLLDVATAPRSEVAGGYFANGRRARAAPLARDAARCRELWERACGMLALEAHESLA